MGRTGKVFGKVENMIKIQCINKVFNKIKTVKKLKTSFACRSKKESIPDYSMVIR